ncbi:glycylpeptide N-tetradecanoyltransferase [Coemansia sp. RSA 552]|nr:glycylpeptide N-tetradecanoyltransferase [Coemansia sp. RSA 552]
MAEKSGTFDAAQLRALMEQLGVGDVGQTKLEREEAEAKEAAHEFWSTQPVPQTAEVVKRDEAVHGPLAQSEIRQEPYELPSASMTWCEVDVEDEGQMRELYTLLTENYVEDSDSMFRFDYSAEFLKWALMAPGYRAQWHVGVRDSDGGLIGFISGIPMRVMVRSSAMEMADINFLCLHKSLRSQRMAPLLIKEVTRRVHLEGIFQAVYTVGRLLPKPVATCRYFHRSINARKLMETGFSPRLEGVQLARTLAALRLPRETATPGLREMRRSDVPQVRKLLNRFLKSRFELVPVFSTDAEVVHWLLPRDSVVWTYVVEEGGKITDFFSFYALPSTVLGAKRRAVKAAYLFYYATQSDYNVQLTDDERTACGGIKRERALVREKTTELVGERLRKVMHDMLILARDAGFDVVNCLDMMDNSLFASDLRFGPGDGFLRYYLFNYRARPIDANKVGFVML